MSLPERRENQLHRELLEAREVSKELWPEPQTTALYKAVHTAARRILSTRDSRLLFNYGELTAAGRVAAEVILKLAKFNGRSRFSTWLYRVIQRELSMIVREVKQRAELQLDALPEVSALHQGGCLHLPDILTLDEATVVRMHIEEGYSFSEMAPLLKLARPKVFRIWLKAKEKLKSRLIC